MTSKLKPGTIRRIIPVTQTLESGGGRIMCIAAELYEDGAYVDFWVNPPAGWQRVAFPMLGVKATDDQETSYTTWIGGGAGMGSDNRWRSSYIVRPAIPDNAEWLELSVRLGRLPDQPGGSFGSIEFDEGSEPVTFRIPLAQDAHFLT